jgi:hypothetical protein
MSIAAGPDGEYGTGSVSTTVTAVASGGSSSGGGSSGGGSSGGGSGGGGSLEWLTLGWLMACCGWRALRQLDASTSTGAWARSVMPYSRTTVAMRSR